MNLGGKEYSIFQILIAIVAIGGAIALTMLGLRTMGVAVPDIVIQALWIVGIVVVIIFAIQAVRAAMGGPGP